MIILEEFSIVSSTILKVFNSSIYFFSLGEIKSKYSALNKLDKNAAKQSTANIIPARSLKPSPRLFRAIYILIIIIMKLKIEGKYLINLLLLKNRCRI